MYLQDSHPVSMKPKPCTCMHQSTIPWDSLEIPVMGIGKLCMKITRMMGNFMNDAFNAPGQLRCLKGHLRLINLPEIDAIHGNG